MKKNLAILYGGPSPENAISFGSAAAVFKVLQASKVYQPYLVRLNENLRFELEKGADKIPINIPDFSFVYEGKKETIACVFLLVHGLYGEDGTLQGFFEMLKIPYTSSAVETSSLTINKFLTKKTLTNIQNVHLAEDRLLDANTPIDTILKDWNFPSFLKPVGGGSSIEVRKVNSIEEVKEHIDKVIGTYPRLMLEQVAVGEEYSIGVFQDKQAITCLPITWIKPQHLFFDFHAKYEGESNEITPAPLSSDLMMMIHDIVSNIYTYLNCKGIVRIDFILAEQKFVFLELNTIPGLSTKSLIPQQVKKAGLTLLEFYEMLIHQTLTER